MGILDYISQKASDVRDRVTGSVQKVGTQAKDITQKALNPPRENWIKNDRKSFEVNKYKIDQHTYPSDLLTPQYGGNYALFYINVSDASRLSIKEDTFDPGEIEPRMRGSLVANAKKLTDTFESVINSTNKAVGEKVGKIDIEAIKNAVPFNGRSQRRLKTAIALHIPNQLSVRYATTWGEADTATAQALMSAGASGVNAVGEAMAGNPTAAKKNLTDMGATGAEAAFAYGLNKVPGAQAIQGATGLASNPKREQTFQGVEFRKFTFDYQFYPRDEAEAQNVLNIIHQFKLHMHPEFKSELNYVWIYPSEFDITYFTNGGENLNLHKHTSCVLESMSVNYTPNGNFSVFANGMPTQINMSLEFRELQLASKETIGLTPGGL